MDERIRSEKFTALVAKWLIEGKLWFDKRPGVVGEPEIDELDIVLNFPAGGERIGNDGSGSFTWREVMGMAEEQGLLK